MSWFKKEQPIAKVKFAEVTSVISHDADRPRTIAKDLDVYITAITHKVNQSEMYLEQSKARGRKVNKDKLKEINKKLIKNKALLAYYKSIKEVE